jgi:hypothetical protein
MNEIKIGDKFWKHFGKKKDICTVIDILKTYNSKKELVKTEYLYEKDFLEQKITGISPGSTIILNKLKTL